MSGTLTIVKAPGPTLLVIDDDQPSCHLVTAIFSREGIHVLSAHDGRSGLERATAHLPDLVLLDLHLPDLGGLEVMEQLQARAGGPPVVMLTAERDVKMAVRATQLGAIDYLTKPIDHDDIVLVVRRVLETRVLQREVAALRRQLGEGGGLAVQMGSSPQTRQVVDAVRTVAPTNFTVLVLGETGTGKELVAQAIHRASERRQQPFIALDCGAIPEALLESELFGHEKGAFTGAERRRAGQFQLAEGGTVFLDEIGNLPMGLQAKLLRVLESRHVQPVGGATATPLDVRFVAASNHDLQERVNAGEFRADLFFRLAQYTIAIPPLRERTGDLAYLAQRFLEEARIELRRPVQEIRPEALDLLVRHRWPGNVRELRNVIRQAVLQTTELAIRRDVVRALVGKPGTAETPVRHAAAGRSLKAIAEEAALAAERQAICETLRSTRGNKSQAARTLSVDYKTLHLKMRKLGIRARDFSP
jgi:two-component system nitrogen regulation response regulator GlnG